MAALLVGGYSHAVELAPDAPPESGKSNVESELISNKAISAIDNSKQIKKDEAPVTASSEIVISNLEAVSSDSMGLYTEAPQSLGLRMWQDTPHAYAISLLRNLPVSYDSAELLSLAQRLLLTAAEAPVKAKGMAEMGDAQLIDVRLQKLWEMGRVREYLAFLQMIPAPAQNQQTAVAEIRALMMADDSAGACQKTSNYLAAYPQSFFLQEAQAFCDAAGGQKDKARLALDVMKECCGEADPVFLALLEGYLDGLPKKVKLPAEPNLLHLAVMKLSATPIPAELAATKDTPTQLKLLAMPGISFEQKVELTEALALKRAVPGSQLRDLYMEAKLRTASTNMEQNVTGWRARALSVQQISIVEDLQQRAKIIESWAKTSRDKSGLVPLALVADLKEFPANTEYAWFAPAAYRLLVRAGEFDLARPWLDAALSNESASVELWPYIRLHRVSETGAAARNMPDAWFALIMQRDAARAESIAGTVNLYGTAAGAEQLLGQMNIIRSGFTANVLELSRALEPSPALLTALLDNANGRRKAEAVALVLNALGRAEMGALSVTATSQAIESLRKAGLENEARHVAAEAMIAAGI